MIPFIMLGFLGAIQFLLPKEKQELPIETPKVISHFDGTIYKVTDPQGIDPQMIVVEPTAQAEAQP